jgi:hypothetical protein
MALFDTPEGRRLLVVSPGSGVARASVIDARTSRSTPLQLDAPATRILMFDAVSPAEPQVRRRALLVGVGGAAQVAFLDLDRLEELGTRNLDTRAMGAVPNAVLPLLDRGLVVIQHGSGGGAGGLSVVDLARRTVAPLVAAAGSRVVVGPAGSDRLWVVPGTDARLGFLTLPALQANEVRLDAGVRQVLPLDRGKDGRTRVVVDHPGAGGRLTVLDADKPERVTARSLAGFLYTDLARREAP